MIMSETKLIDIKELKFDEHNFNRHNDEGMSLLEKSIKENGLGRSILLDKDNNIVGGNGVTEKAIELGKTKVRIIETDGTELIAVKRTDLTLDSEQGRKMALADNSVAHVNLEWNEEELQKAQDEWGLVPEEWGVEMPDFNVNYEDEDAEIERKKKEFEARMEAGELSDDDPEYQEFLKKFEAKKTTDDCYTPEIIYDAIADWVAGEYNVSRADFVRPFYPQGDYQRENYKSTDIVVDNPPFSILSEIIRFYLSKKVRFFLFSPSLTLFSSSSSLCTSIAVGVPITYENGATVNTSFVTNMEEGGIRFKSEPNLYKSVKEANDKNLKELKRQLPKYSYDHHIIISPFMSALSRLGIPMSVPVAESEVIDQLDAQKATKKAIYGKGYIVSDYVFAEREKAEREKAERWELSAREVAIVEKLNKAGKVSRNV